MESKAYFTRDGQATAQTYDFVSLAVHLVCDEVRRHVPEAVGDIVEEGYRCCSFLAYSRQFPGRINTHSSAQSSSDLPHNAPSR